MAESGTRVIRRRQFFKYAGFGALAAGVMGRSAPSLWAKDSPKGKMDRSKLDEYPTLSLKEKDRRWTLMQDHKLEALLVAADAGEGGLDGSVSDWFTNDEANATIFFPLQLLRLI